MNSANFLARALNWLATVFEAASPSVFALLAVLLPYLSPLPVAWITAGSAKVFLGMTPWIAGVFVFVLEGLGIWTTSSLVDSLVEYIRSRNTKSGLMVGAFLLVVGVYIIILVSLNVSLEEAAGKITPLYARVLTLVCFLPLISGCMNGYWKLRLERKTDIERQREIEERRHQEERADRRERWLIKHGQAPTVTYAKDAEGQTSKPFRKS
jgi:uncharacterized protein YjeT (DUF2065 family)